jgi:hypothetical protein
MEIANKILRIVIPLMFNVETSKNTQQPLNIVRGCVTEDPPVYQSQRAFTAAPCQHTANQVLALIA